MCALAPTQDELKDKKQELKEDVKKVLTGPADQLKKIRDDPDRGKLKKEGQTCYANSNCESGRCCRVDCRVTVAKCVPAGEPNCKDCPEYGDDDTDKTGPDDLWWQQPDP